MIADNEYHYTRNGYGARKANASSVTDLYNRGAKYLAAVFGPVPEYNNMAQVYQGRITMVR